MTNIITEKKYEIIPVENNLNIKAHVTKLMGSSKTRFHWHKSIEFIIPMDCTIHVLTTEREFVVEKDEIFIVNSNELHCLLKKCGRNHVLITQIPLTLFESYYPEVRQIKFEHIVIHGGEDKKNYLIILKYILKIVDAIYKKDDGYVLRTMGWVNLLFYVLLKKIPYTTVSGEYASFRNNDLKRMERILNDIHDGYSCHVTLAEIAKQEGLTVYYLSHYIKKYLGMSYREYINKLRLDKAADLLINTNKKNTDICTECGFSDYRYMNNAFLKKYHCTPAKFRKKFQVVKKRQKSSSVEDNIAGLGQYDILNEEQSYHLLKDYFKRKTRSQS